MENQNVTTKTYATVKNVLRLISVILIAIFFLPTFLVSCSGQDIEISAKTIMAGYSIRGEEVIEPHAMCVIFFFIPIALLVIWILKNKLSLKKTALISSILGILDFFLWIYLKSSVKEAALDNSCTFKTTGWFLINQILLILLSILSVGIYFNYISIDSDIFQLFGRIKTDAKIVQDNLSDSTVRYCENCGNKIQEGNQFCTKCGTKIE